MKRVQHFVPRFILKKFLDSDKFRFFDKRYKKSLPKTPKGSMYKEYFYEHDDFDSNEVEDLLASRETVYAPIIEKLISREKLTFEEHETLIEFRHVTYYRSNEFICFYTHKKDRGEYSSEQRLDWFRINSIFEFTNHEENIKLTQLRAIKDVISKRDAAYQMSAVTPVCVVAIAENRKFAIGDNGSISMGEEFDGVTIIVISPSNALIFPKTRTALELMKEMGATNQESTILYVEVTDEYVDFINERITDRAYEYYINPNT